MPHILHYYARNSRRHRLIVPKWSGLLTTLQTDHSLGEWMVVCLTGWSAAQEHHRGLYSHHSSSLCTPQTSSASQSPVICRNAQMTLQLWAVSVMDKRLSTERPLQPAYQKLKCDSTLCDMWRNPVTSTVRQSSQRQKSVVMYLVEFLPQPF